MINVADNPLVQAQIRKSAEPAPPKSEAPPAPLPVRYTRAPLAPGAGPAPTP